MERGDVLGYYIERNDDPIQLAYINGTTNPDAPESTIYMLKNVSGPLCYISRCDAHLKFIHKAAPIIYTEFSEYHYLINGQSLKLM